MKMRTEKDSLGVKSLPASVLYGIETARALENFPISGARFHPDFFWALAQVKKACAAANAALGLLGKRRGNAIIRACDEIIHGKHSEYFITDVLQSGAGVSAHMNANEIIANRALEILGKKKGDYGFLHAHDHVNMGQSTNDVIPTAMRLAALKLHRRFNESAKELEGAFKRKSREFSRVIKAGRTHLQDAAPLTLGQEFGGWGRQLQKSRLKVLAMTQDLFELGIGGSAVGTGLNTTLQYRKKVIQNLRSQTGFSVKTARNLFEVMQSDADFSGLSGGLRTYALCLIQISGDLRLLSSGPNTGFYELFLPPRQPGSSIMPGKVNPVMPEAVQQTAYQVLGFDAAVNAAVGGGQLELNVMRPVIAYNILQALECLANACRVYRTHCIEGIRGNEERMRRYAEESFGIAAALNPYIGYSRAALCVKKAAASGKTLKEVVIEEGLLNRNELDRILSPVNLTRPKAR